MSRRNVPLYEQGTSLKSTLESIGLEHGDTAQVTLTGVGIKADASAPSGFRLCFCPAEADILGEVQHGTAAERRQPIPTDVTFSRRAARRLRQAVTSNHGFIEHMEAFVHTNGSIHVYGVQNIQFSSRSPEVCVNHANSYSG